MTALATIHLQKAVIMAADSLEIEIDDYETRNVVGSGLTQKLFLLQRTGTGISACGYSAWEDESLGDILRGFASTACLAPGLSQSDVAQALAAFLSDRYPGLKTSFHLAGFDGEEPSVFELDHQDGSPWTIVRSNTGADGAPSNNIIVRCERKTRLFIRRRYPDLKGVSIGEALEIVRAFFDFEIETVRAAKNPPDVDGPIDILVLSPGGQWFKAVKDEDEAIIDSFSIW